MLWPANIWATVTDGRTPITGHLGVRYDNFDAFGGSADKFSVFAGAEVPITQTGDISAVGEVGTKIADGGKIALLDWRALSSAGSPVRRFGRSGATGHRQLVAAFTRRSVTPSTPNKFER